MAGEAPRVSVGRMSVRGVDAATARGLGPAIDRALSEAVRRGEVAGHVGDLQLRLPAGATAGDIAAALARALGRGR